MRTWPEDGSTRAVLARTNRELLPAVIVALGLGVPFRAPRIDLPLESLQDREAELHCDEPINIQYTSGTTPKGATLRRARGAGPATDGSPPHSWAGRSASPTWRPS
jgi:hypothetical protein